MPEKSQTKISEIDEEIMYKELLKKNEEAKKANILAISSDISRQSLERMKESGGAFRSIKTFSPSPKDIFQNNYE